jgi:hypothetical protein
MINNIPKIKIENILQFCLPMIDINKAKQIGEKTKEKITEYSIDILANQKFSFFLASLTLSEQKYLIEKIINNNSIEKKSFQLALWCVDYGGKQLISRDNAYKNRIFIQKHHKLINTYYNLLTEEKLGIRLLNISIYFFMSRQYHLVNLEQKTGKYIPKGSFAFPPKEELLCCSFNEFDLLTNKSAPKLGIKSDELFHNIDYYMEEIKPIFNLHDIMGHLNAWEYSQAFSSPLKSFVWLSENHSEVVPSIPSPEDYVNLPSCLPPDSDAVLISLTAKQVQKFLNKNYDIQQAFEKTSEVMANYLMAKVNLPDPLNRIDKYWGLKEEILIERLLVIMHYNKCEYITIFFELLSITQGFSVDYYPNNQDIVTASEKLEVLKEIDYLFPYELYYGTGIALFWACIKVAKTIYNRGLARENLLLALKVALDIVEYKEDYFPTPQAKSPDILHHLIMV